MLFANNCNTTLNGGITAIATSMVVASATGFPVPTGSQYFYCTLADAATQTTIEIVKVTAVSGTTFTIVRGQDGTTGTIFASGAVVSLRLVRASLNDFPKLDETNTFTGSLYIGNATPKSPWVTGTVPFLAIEQSTTYTNISAYAYSTAATAGGILTLGRSKSATLGTLLTTTTNDSLGFIDFEGVNTANTLVAGAYIGSYQTGTAGASYIPASLNFYTSNGTTAPAQNLTIFGSGGVSIGNTTDPGATNLSVTGSVKAGSYVTAKGITSIPVATPTTIFGMSTAGVYQVVVSYLNSGNATQFSAFANIIWDGTTGVVFANNGTYVTITQSSGNVQVTNVVGLNMNWSYLLITL